MNKMPTSKLETPTEPGLVEVLDESLQRVINGALAVERSKSQVPISVPLVNMALDETLDQVDRSDFGLAA